MGTAPLISNSFSVNAITEKLQKSEIALSFILLEDLIIAVGCTDLKQSPKVARKLMTLAGKTGVSLTLHLATGGIEDFQLIFQTSEFTNELIEHKDRSEGAKDIKHTKSKVPEFVEYRIVPNEIEKCLGLFETGWKVNLQKPMTISSKELLGFG
jgi:hypothetical protein